MCTPCAKRQRRDAPTPSSAALSQQFQLQSDPTDEKYDDVESVLSVLSMLSMNSTCGIEDTFTDIDLEDDAPDLCLSFNWNAFGQDRTKQLCEFLSEFPLSFTRMFWQHDVSGYQMQWCCETFGWRSAWPPLLPSWSNPLCKRMAYARYSARPCPHFILGCVSKFLSYSEAKHVEMSAAHFSRLRESLQMRLVDDSICLCPWQEFGPSYHRQFCLCSECWTEHGTTDRTTHSGISFIHYWNSNAEYFNPGRNCATPVRTESERSDEMSQSNESNESDVMGSDSESALEFVGVRVVPLEEPECEPSPTGAGSDSPRQGTV